MSEMLDYSPIGVYDPANTLIAFGAQQLRFTGAGVSVMLSGGQTVVTVPGGGGGAGNPNRFAFYNAGGVLTDSANLTFDSTSIVAAIGTNFGSYAFSSSSLYVGDFINATTTGHPQFIAGEYNDETLVPLGLRLLFQIGNGTGVGTRSNAISTFSDGTTQALINLTDNFQILAAGGVISNGLVGYQAVSSVGSVTANAATPIHAPISQLSGRLFVVSNMNAAPGDTVTIPAGGNVITPGGVDIVLDQYDTACFVWDESINMWLCTSVSDNS